MDPSSTKLAMQIQDHFCEDTPDGIACDRLSLGSGPDAPETRARTFQLVEVNGPGDERDLILVGGRSNLSCTDMPDAPVKCTAPWQRAWEYFKVMWTSENS